MTSLPVDSTNRNSSTKVPSNRRRGRRSRRKTLEKLVAEGTKNYPAYLKLIYTGDSEQSEEEEEVEEEGEDTNAEVKVNHPPRGHGVRAAGEVEESVIVGRQGDNLLSPESVKLLDPGKEKAQTPNDSKAQVEEEDAAVDVVSNETDKGKLCNEEQPNDNQQQQQQQQQQQPDNNHRSNEEQWKLELFQLQDDIISLKEMLSGKLQIAADLKQRLGITPMTGFRQSIFSFKDSGSYFKTSAVLKSMVAYASNKMGSLRNSVIFKSVEEKVVKVKSRSMSQMKPKLHRKLSGSKSDSSVSHLSNRDRKSNCEEEGKTTDPPLTPPNGALKSPPTSLID